MSFNIPVLLITFNKLEQTRKLIESLKVIQPKKIYVSNDGPRFGVDRDEVVYEVRSLIEKEINWDCDVIKIYHSQNLGCAKCVPYAINYLFQNEELGIILEEDCIPSPDFFEYQKEMLLHYKDDMRVMAICGYKPLKCIEGPSNSYYFSRYVSFWGWGTWKRAWAKFDFEMDELDTLVNSGLLRRNFPTYIEYSANKIAFTQTKEGKNSSWGYRWAYSMIINRGVAIYPYCNTIVNIGFSIETATHTTSKLGVGLSDSYQDMNFPLIHPNNILINRVAELIYAKKTWRSRVIRFNTIQLLKSAKIYGILRYIWKLKN
ncbi:hypothetical protein [Vibrio sp. M260112]|uniref:hypothetical protein n=1 Tax=Vibrio sp. M260112 TaxID=3020895 RepID=UPI002F4190E0